MAKSNHTFVIIDTEGEVTLTPGKAELKELQKAVGGYIATAELIGGIVGYVDDEGLLKESPRVNMVATSLSKYGQTFFGPWAGNLTERQVERLRREISVPA